MQILEAYAEFESFAYIARRYNSAAEATSLLSSVASLVISSFMKYSFNTKTFVSTDIILLYVNLARQARVIIYSRTSRKRTPTVPRVSVHLREVSAYRRVKKITRGHIMHQKEYFKAVRPLVTA